MICSKLTDENDRTHGGCQWGADVTHEASGTGQLCARRWIHVYDDSLLAVMMNPIHGEFDLQTAHLWECYGEGATRNNRGLKRGWAKVTTLRRIDLPQVTTAQRVRFAILCAWEVCDGPTWRTWAKRWLSGKDRSAKAAAAAAGAWAEAEAAGWAAWAAAEWAESAWWAAAVEAAYAAEAAARAAPLDLPALARRAVQGKEEA
jgi:hypothetical protein